MNVNLRSEKVAGIVAGASFFASAGHIVSVVDETNHIVFALAYPIGIDGLIYVGIRAIQTGRPVAGMLALLVGAFYSLAFNAHAEDALTMNKLLIASSMPVCMFAAFLIEATAKKAVPVEKTPAPVEVALPAPAPKPIAWVAAGARWTLPIIPLQAPAPIKVKSSVVRPAIAKRTDTPAIEGRTDGQMDGRTDGRTQRRVAWDVEKAVGLLMDGRTSTDVATVVGTNRKAIERTRRAMVLIQGDASLSALQVSEMMDKAVSALHVLRVMSAMEKVKA